MPDTALNAEAIAAPAFRNRSNNIAKLAEALAAAQKNFAPIPKDREVTVYSEKGSYKFKYATLGAIRTATMPALCEQKLALVQGMTDDGKALETTLLHASGEWIRNVTPMYVSGRRGKDGQTYPPSNQELGSAQSYARRYGISALLCVTADEDDDGNIADGNGMERVPFKPAKGMAGGGGEFRPAGRRPVSDGPTSDWVGDAKRDGIVDETRAKGTLKPTATAETPAEKKAAKVKAATDKRTDALKSKAVWTRPEFWTDNATWIDWMADPANEVLKEYERFTTAYEDADETVRPVDLA